MELKISNPACHIIHKECVLSIQRQLKKTQTQTLETLEADTSEFSVPLQYFFSSFKMRMVSASFKEENAEPGTSEEHRKKPGSLDEK